MNYIGKLYGKVHSGPDGYFYTGKTSDDWDKLESQNKDLIESIESLLILIDSRLGLMDGETIGKGKSHIWKKVIKTAQDLVKQSKS